MADAIFPKAKKRAMGAGLDLLNADVRVMLVKSTYAYDAADEFVADLGAVDNGRSAALAGKALGDDGTFDADDSTLNAGAGDPCNALVIFLHTGADATARLIAYLDSVVGLPFTPEGGQACPIVWSNGANKIFKL
jgi:hypothetical protein